MAVGALCSLLGIGAAFYLYMVAPGSTLRLRDRFRRTHDFLVNRWYFDELHRRARLPARSSPSAGSPTTPSSGSCPGHRPRDQRRRSAASATIVRTAQSGFVRFYALLVIGGLAGLALYFLLVAS